MSEGTKPGGQALEHGPRVIDEPFYTSSPYEPQLPPVQSVADIDLTNPRLYDQGDPHAAFALLRDEAPVFWNRTGTRGTRDKGYWAITSYEGFDAVHTQPDIFSRTDSPFLDLLADDMPTQIVSLDPPVHGEYRRLLHPFFSRRAVERMEANMAPVVSAIFDQIPIGQPFDFATAVAQPIPFLTTCTLIGVSPEAVAGLAAELTQLDFDDPTAQMQGAVMIKAAFDELAEDAPDDSMMSGVLSGEIDGKAIDRDDALNQLWISFIGGLDTTTHALTYGMLSFFHHPSEWQRLQTDPELLMSAIEEVLRWVAPSQVIKHMVQEPIEIEGVELKPGDYTGTYLGAINRDEKYFPDPYRFDIGRKSSKAISTFGRGAHTCLGAHITRMEMKLVFGELLKRYARVELAGPVERGRAFSLLIVPPLASLPVVVHT